MRRYYQGQITHFAEDDDKAPEESPIKVTEAAEKVSYYRSSKKTHFMFTEKDSDA
jgi:hypothetical protein